MVTGAEVSDVGLLRLVAQGLVGPRPADPLAAVRHLLALQGQVLPGVLQSVALRTGGTAADVRAALDEGALVRSWPMRGTLHLVAAEDLPWLLDLLSARPLAGAAKRRAHLGLTEQDVARAAEVAEQALHDRRLSRQALLAVLSDGGVDVSGQRGYHVLWYLAQTGLVVLGPTDDGDQAFVLLDEHVPSPRRRDRDEALAELALRFFVGHGPASVQDLARWADLPLRDVRAGLAAVRDQLEEGPDGMLMAPDLPDRLAACREEAEAVHLLPGFDEVVLGYGDRAHVLDPAQADRICPGRNGVFRPTVVAGGRVVGTWSRDRKGAPVFEPFTTWPPGVERQLPARAAALPA